MNVVIPMAGKGRRFREAGYDKPKPLINVADKRMVDWVVGNMPPWAITLIVPRELRNIRLPGFDVRYVGHTEGAADSVLYALDAINNPHPLIVANCDQVVEWDVADFIRAGTTGHATGAIAVFDCPERDPKWSYVGCGDGGWIYRVAEKEPFSDMATCGIYLWRHGSDFVDYACRMIANEQRTNGEFYVAPVFQGMIDDGHNIAAYGVKRMYGMGTPEDLEAALKVLK